MNSKTKLILIILLPLILITAWLYALFSILNGNKNNTIKADINQSKKQFISHNKENKDYESGTKQNTKISSFNTPKNSPTKENKIKVIKIYIPERFNLIGRKKIKKQLLTNNKIYLKIISFPYDKNKILRKLATKQLDIALINSDDNDFFSSISYEIKFKKTLSSVTNFIFYDLTSGNNIKFIPYCIDPLVSLVKNDINIKNTSPYNIIKFFFSYPEKISPITINFGISPILTKIFLEKGKFPSETYKYNLFSILLITNLTKDNNFLKTIMERTDSKKIQLFSTKNFLKITRILSKKNTICKTNPDSCLIKYNIIKIAFTNLSSLNLLKKDSYKIYTYPTNGGKIYPVIGRNFIVNKKSSNIIDALFFINSYIKEGLNNNYQLWNNCLSAFNNIYEKQKTNPKYSKFIQYEENFFLLTNTNTKLEKLFKNTKLLEVFKGNYSIEGFFDNFDISNYLY